MAQRRRECGTLSDIDRIHTVCVGVVNSVFLIVINLKDVRIIISYNIHKLVDFARLIELFNEAGWKDKTSDLERLKQMVENSQIVVTAWDDDQMVGFARCTTDYVFNGQINNVVVDSRYRNQGIGKGLVSRILNSNERVTYMLRSETENEAFYRSMGLENTDRGMVYNRKI